MLLEQSADRPQTAGLVIQPFRQLLKMCLYEQCELSLFYCVLEILLLTYCTYYIQSSLCNNACAAKVK